MKWKTVKLGDIADFSNGLNFDKSAYSDGIKLIGVSNFGTRFSPDYSELSEVSAEIVREADLLQNGDIVFVRSNGNKELVGRCMLITKAVDPVTYSGFVIRCRIHDQDKYDPVFFTYHFKSKAFRQAMAGTAVGANIQNLSQGRLSSYSAFIPDTDSQHHIAEILSSYDDLIENNQKQIKLLEEAAQRLYKEWFIDLRFPGYETTPVHDGVPEGWEKTSIDSHITLYSGFAFKSSDFADKGQYKIVTIKNVKDAQFIADNVSFIKEIPSQMPDHCKLSDGNILLSLTGNVGRVCLVFGENYLLNQRVAKLCSPFPGFTYCLFRSKDMFDAMSNLANGAAQQNLSPIRTGKLEALFPCSETVQQFENIVVPMLQKIVLLNKEILSAAQSRDRLLPKLMSGEIEV